MKSIFIMRFLLMKNIHNTKNVLHLPTSVHNAIIGHYNWSIKIWNIQYSHYRDYVKTLNFDKQYELWLKAIRDLGYWNYIK